MAVARVEGGWERLFLEPTARVQQLEGYVVDFAVPRNDPMWLLRLDTARKEGTSKAHTQTKEPHGCDRRPFSPGVKRGARSSS